MFFGAPTKQAGAISEAIGKPRVRRHIIKIDERAKLA
jgi:hypothetical protein